MWQRSESRRELDWDLMLSELWKKKRGGTALAAVMMLLLYQMNVEHTICGSLNPVGMMRCRNSTGNQILHLLNVIKASVTCVLHKKKWILYGSGLNFRSLDKLKKKKNQNPSRGKECRGSGSLLGESSRGVFSQACDSITSASEFSCSASLQNRHLSSRLLYYYIIPLLSRFT